MSEFKIGDRFLDKKANYHFVMEITSIKDVVSIFEGKEIYHEEYELLGEFEGSQFSQAVAAGNLLDKTQFEPFNN